MYNYKVIASLKDDITKEEKEHIYEKIKYLMNLLGVKEVYSDTYSKSVSDSYDFPSCFSFYSELKNFSKYFEELVFYDLKTGDREIASDNMKRFKNFSLLLLYDFNIGLLKRYYDFDKPKEACVYFEKFIEKNGFKKIDKGHYESDCLSRLQLYNLLDSFARKNKWFSLSLNMLKVLRIGARSDLIDEIIEDNIDHEYKLSMEKQYEELFE